MEAMGWIYHSYLDQCQCMIKLIYSVSQADRWVQIVGFLFWFWVFCCVWLFSSWQQWNLSNGSPFFYWSLTLFINFLKFHVEKYEKVPSCVNALIIEERVPLMSAAVSAHSLLMPGRVIEQWCSAGHVLQAEAGRECSCRHKSIWNSSPTSSFIPTLLFFLPTLLVCSFVGKQVSCLLSHSCFSACNK